MSFFSKMFGGKKENSMTTGEAIQNLRETENMLIKKQEFLEKKIEQEITTAKTNGTKNKRGMSLCRTAPPPPHFSFISDCAKKETTTTTKKMHNDDFSFVHRKYHIHLFCIFP